MSSLDDRVWKISLNRLFVLCCLLFACAAQAEIYKWVDDQGKVHFGDSPPADKKLEPLELKINTYEAPQIVYAPAEPRTQQKKQPKVVMYSAEWCRVCKRASAYFKQHKIRYLEFDVDKSEKGRQDFAKLKGTGVPIILVGDARLNGFSPERFEELYQP